MITCGPRIKKSLAALAAILGPWLLALYWQKHNLNFWDSDANRYMRVMMLGFRQIPQGGLFAGLARGYQELARYGPAGTMIDPLLSVPFPLFTHGKVLSAVAAHNSLIFAVFLAYVFAIAARFVSPLRASLITMSVGFTPYIFSTTNLLMPELPLLMCTAAIIYHLIRCRYFSSGTQTLLLALWLALAVCVRPLLAIGMFSGPVTMCLAVGIRRKNLNRRDILAWSVQIAAAGIALALFIRQGRQWPLRTNNSIFFLLPVLLISVSCIALRKKLGLTSKPIIALSLGTALVSAWLIPLGVVLFNWVWSNTFGSALQVQKGGRAGFHLLHSIGSMMGGPPLLGVSLLALFSIATSRGKSAPKILLISLLGILPMILGPLTYNNDLRYHYSAFFILYLVASIVALTKSAPFPKFRAAIFSTIILFQASGVVVRTVHADVPFKKDMRVLTDNWPEYLSPLRSPNEGPSPQAAVIRELNPYLPTRGKIRIGVIQPIIQNPFTSETEPDLLFLTETGSGLNWWFDRPVFLKRSFGKIISFIKANYDFLLVGPEDLSIYRGDQPTPGWAQAAYASSTALSRELLDMSHQGLLRFGLSFVGKIPLGYGTNYRSFFVLYRVVPSPKASMRTTAPT